MSLMNKLTYKPNKLSTDENLRRLFVSHKDYLKKHPATREVAIVQAELVAHRFNFYAYLNKINIEQKLHWVIFLINDIENPDHFDTQLGTILIPDIGIVEEIVAMHS